jgi:hypothetical protein
MKATTRGGRGHTRRVSQRARLLRQAKRQPGVADVLEVTLAAMKAQATIAPFFLAPEATGSYANNTN